MPWDVDYLEILEKVWDSRADSYDAHFRSRLVSKYMHARTMEVLSAYFSEGMHVLEIGSGTGEEAIALAKRGIHVTAIDISAKMIKNLQKKAKREKVDKIITCRVLPVERIEELSELKFDGAYSLLGPLNCVNDIKPIAEVLSQQILPGGYFIASVINKFCLSELFYNVLLLNMKTAFRRFKPNPVKAVIDKDLPAINLWYYNANSFYEYFKNHFEFRSAVGLPVILPAQGFENFFSRHRKVFNIMTGIESKLHDKLLFKSIGDHFLITMKRKHS